MNPDPASAQIETRLQSVRRSIRRVQLLRALLVVATVALGGLLLMMAADFLLAPLAAALRWAMFALWAIAVAVAVWRGFRPLFRNISLVQVARWIELRHPEIEERLSTSVELSASAGASGSLLQALAQAAGEDADRVDPAAEVAAVRTTRRWAGPALAAIALLVVGFIAWPSEMARLLVRAVAPFSASGNVWAGLFTIKPGDLEVMAGDRVEIEVTYDGTVRPVALRMDLENGPQVTQAMVEEDGVFRYVLDPVRTSFRYQARAGRAESDSFVVTVAPAPTLTSPRALLEFPAYTGVLPQDEPVGRSLEAVAGTKVTLTGNLNTGNDSAWLTIADQRVAEATLTDGKLAISWTLEPSVAGEAVVTLKHRLGREIEALRFMLTVTEDRDPAVYLLTPNQRDLRVRPDETLRVTYEATDDFAIERMAVEIEAGDKSGTIDQELPVRVAGTQPPVFRGSLDLALGALRAVYPGNEMRIRLLAEDGRPQELAGPGRGQSEWITLRFDDAAESLVRQEMLEQQQAARDSIEQALRAAREARDQFASQGHDIRQEEIRPEAKARLEEAAAKLAAASEELEELAQRMEETPLAARAEELREISEVMDQARQDAEEAPLQDAADERTAKLDAAREQADQAVAKLESLRNALNQDQPKLEDLARMAELAQQQQELARQAQANADQQPEQVAEDWQERQRRIEEALRQQLRERPDARAEALQAQAEAARALADEARQIAADQQELREQSQQAAADEPTEELRQALREALVEEQGKIAAEAKAQHEQAEQSGAENAIATAAKAADKAHAELQAGEMESAASATAEAAEAMQQAAEPNAETPGQEEPAGQPAAAEGSGERLPQLAERQQQLAEAVAALARGEVKEAMRELQESGAEAAAEVAQAVQALPQVDNSGAVQEAQSTSRAGSERAAEAAAGEQHEAANRHDQSGQDFQKSADALERAANELARAAQEAAGQPPNPQQAPLSPSDLAEAFQEATQAAGNPQPAAAAQQASNAASALSRAVQAGMQQMRGTPGQPGNQPGQEPMAGPRPRQADPGLPPELGKLGISVADWEKIRSSLRSDVGASGAEAVPEEYRELVRGYFENLSKGAGGK